jgi:uncharacterized surface protein with fasciclin (FAS1) repeats
MKNKKIIGYLFGAFLLLPAVLSFQSCKDILPGAESNGENNPAWLASSIYDYLKEDGNFNYYVKIIDQAVQDDGTSYAEVLKKTGSKTLFVAQDDAFDAFFADNVYGIRKFEDLSPAMCRAILFSGMLNDTYLIEMLSNIPGDPPIMGQAMRRTTSWEPLDSIAFEDGNRLPENSYWDRFRQKGIHLYNYDYTMVHFLSAQMRTQGITNEDFEIITGIRREESDAYVFDIKVIEKDITCQNGYIHVLEKLLFPRENMAEYLRRDPNTQLFNRFIERYTVPFYSLTATEQYRALHPEFRDSIFRKNFYNSQNLPDGGAIADPNGNIVNGMLSFDPGDNSFYSTGSFSSLPTDMGAMFVPSDAALRSYFDDPNGTGFVLKQRYGSWENVPNDVLSILINNHMKTSFVASVPSRFSALEDKMGTPLGIKREHIDYAYICSNGVVYVTNKVFPPTEYASVMAPIIINDKTTVFNWAIKNYKFDLYLLAMEEGIRYSLLTPTDDVFDNYINPISIAQGKPERWKFRLNDRSQMSVTAYDLATGDSLRNFTSSAIIESHLKDILDNHILLEDIEDGKSFYPTKGGATVKVAGKGLGARIEGGANLEAGETVGVTQLFNTNNGITYFLDKIAQTPLNSVYKILSTTPEYEEFFELCAGAKEYAVYDNESRKNISYSGPIFSNDNTFIGMTMNVAFFNTFNYTVYVPTNEKVRAALAAGKIKTWEQIAAMANASSELDVLLAQAKEAQKLYNYLRYYFQDNSVYISGESLEKTYNTATRKENTSRFHQITVKSNGANLQLTTDAGGTANVITSDPKLYNIMARDYKFNTRDIAGATQIETSSFAVIHQIDELLDYQ